jgi:hypothetical protein
LITAQGGAAGGSHGVRQLPAQKVRQGPVRVRKPKQTKHPDDEHLADNRKTINEKSGDAASDGRFD